MNNGQDEYQEPIMIDTTGAIVRVYRPVLDEDERVRRMKRIHDAAAELLRDTHKRKA